MLRWWCNKEKEIVRKAKSRKKTDEASRQRWNTTICIPSSSSGWELKKVMSMNFPLILFLLVFFSGVIWLIDTIFFLRKRNQLLQEIQAKFPKEKEWSKKQISSYEAEVKKLAREPIIVEYSRAFFPVLLFVFIVRSFIRFILISV